MADDEDASEWQFETEEVSTEGDEEPSEAGATEDAAPADDDQWRYSLSDLEASEGEETDQQSAVGGNVFGSFSSDTEVIEPGSPDLENTLFVIVGALLTLVFFLQFYLLIG